MSNEYFNKLNRASVARTNAHKPREKVIEGVNRVKGHTRKGRVAAVGELQRILSSWDLLVEQYNYGKWTLVKWISSDMESASQNRSASQLMDMALDIRDYAPLGVRITVSSGNEELFTIEKPKPLRQKLADIGKKVRK